MYLDSLEFRSSSMNHFPPTVDFQHIRANHKLVETSNVHARRRHPEEGAQEILYHSDHAHLQ